METVIGDPKKETILYDYMKKVRPYLDEVMNAIRWPDLRHQSQAVYPRHLVSDEDANKIGINALSRQIS